MSPVVRSMRLSFIWTESAADELGGPVSLGPPLAFVRTPGGYGENYPRMRRGTLDGGASVPWLEGPGQRFWKYYLGKNPDQASWSDAWRGLVPMRDKLGWQLEARWLPGRANVERYYYPYGRAVIVTISIAPAAEPTVPPLDSIVQLAYRVRRNGQFTITQPGLNSFEVDLEGLATCALDEARKRVLGEKAVSGAMSLTPFSVFTFLQLDPVDPNVPITEGGEVHLALDALATWNPAHPAVTPQSLSRGVLSAGFSSSSALYAAPRGRVVWVPAKAADPASDYLSCYHRTMVFLSLQLESLGAFVQQVAPIVSLHNHEQRDVARLAAGLLGRLHGQKETFRNPSCPRHIEDNGWLGGLDRLRKVFGWPRIAR